MNPQWEARYEGRGRFRLRRRGRWIGCLRSLVLLWLAGLVGAGAAAGLWQRLDRWLWDTMHLTGGTAVGVLAVAILFWWLWRQAERGPKS